MGSHYRQVAILVRDDKLDCFGILRKKFSSDKNGPAFYPGPVLPPRTDVSPMEATLFQIMSLAMSFVINAIFGFSLINYSFHLKIAP